MLASGRPPASTVPAYCRSIKRPVSLRQRCRPTTAVLVSPSPTPIPRRKATGRRLDPTSSDLTPRPNPHRARGTDGAPTSRDFVPRRFSDAGRPGAYKGRHCRRPKTCTHPDIAMGLFARSAASSDRQYRSMLRVARSEMKCVRRLLARSIGAPRRLGRSRSEQERLRRQDLLLLRLRSLRHAIGRPC